LGLIMISGCKIVSTSLWDGYFMIDDCLWIMDQNKMHFLFFSHFDSTNLSEDLFQSTLYC
jgi:hypothetical protein